MINNQFDCLQKWSKYTPNRLFLREYDRKIDWTYSDFNNRTNAFTRYLEKTNKIKKGDRIAVYSKNRSEYVLILLACIKLGAIIVPLNYRLTPRELDVLISDANPTLFIYESDFDKTVANIKSITKSMRKIKIESTTPFLTDTLLTESITTEKIISEDDIVMILYTAGTTGLPKGAIITHKMLFWNSINTSLRLDLTSADHTQSYAPFFHTGGWNVLFTPFLHHGASHTLLSKFDPDLILQLMEKEKTTLFFGVPTMLQMIADSPYFDKVDLSSVRYAIVGGAPMPIPLINIWHKKGIYIRQGYGLTEVGPNCFSLHHDDAIRKKGSIGFPNYYVETKIINDAGKECQPNEVGELWLKSPVVTPGYWNKPNETSTALTDGWFHTGDMVKVDDEDYVYVVDRKKNMFISGGENVYPAEVEAFIVTHPSVKEVAVIGVPDERWGEVGKAFIVQIAKSELADDDIINYCKGKLAKYKIPKYVSFIEELPRNEAGKINKMDLINIHHNKTKGE
ncbi:long-chain fatty acid--CoA ligase [bacterium]|nr:long-chain fatty acid--CoA ligase [bacterium]